MHGHKHITWTHAARAHSHIYTRTHTLRVYVRTHAARWHYYTQMHVDTRRIIIHIIVRAILLYILLYAPYYYIFTVTTNEWAMTAHSNLWADVRRCKVGRFALRPLYVRLFNDWHLNTSSFCHIMHSYNNTKELLKHIAYLFSQVFYTANRSSRNGCLGSEDHKPVDRPFDTIFPATSATNSHCTRCTGR